MCKIRARAPYIILFVSLTSKLIHIIADYFSYLSNPATSTDSFTTFQLKAKEEERKRILGKWSDQKLGPESPSAPKKLYSTATRHEKSKSAGVLKKNVSICINNSFSKLGHSPCLFFFRPFKIIDKFIAAIRKFYMRYSVS